MASIVALLILAASAPFTVAATAGSPEGISRSGSPDRFERIDDRVLTCNAMAFCLVSTRCLDSDFRMEDWDKIARKYCGRELEFAADLNRAVFGEALQMAGRKLKLKARVDSSNLNQLSGKQLSEEKEKDFRSTAPPMVLAVPGMFLLSCLVICPCFRAKRKEQTEQKALANEQNSCEQSNVTQ